MDLQFATCDSRSNRPPRRAATASISPTEINTMNSPFNPQPATRHRPLCRPGFSFTEILFAIMILGIGFIMVAAMFPAALQQTDNSTQETIAAAVARSGVAYVSQLGQSTFVATTDLGFPGTNLLVLRPTLNPPLPIVDDFDLWTRAQAGDPVLAGDYPPIVAGTQVIPGDVWSLDFTTNDVARKFNGIDLPAPQPLGRMCWNTAAQNMVQLSDPRYAWVAFYKRDLIETVKPGGGGTTFAFAPSAQVIVVAVRSRNVDGYSNQDVVIGPGLSPSLQPVPVVARIIPPSPGTLDYTIQFNPSASPNSDRFTEGAFVIVATDDLPRTTFNHGLLNGHVYRLGNRSATGSGVFEFAPGFGPTAGDGLNLTAMGAVNFTVFMLGKGMDPDNPNTGSFTGTAQDIAVYSTFITCSSN